MKTEKKTPNKTRKTENKTLTAPCYKREDIESILTNVMLVSVTVAAALLALTFFIAVLKH